MRSAMEGKRVKRQHVYFGAAAVVASAVLLAAGYGLGRASRTEQDMARAVPQKVYVIQEFSYRWRHNRAPSILDDGGPGKPVMAFLERDRADAHCHQLNLQKRATSNPFRYMPEGGEYTSMGKAKFLAFVRAQGLTPPADYPDGEDDIAWAWADWWEEHGSKWDKAIVERLLQALDRVWFYEVVEVPLGR